MDLTYLKEIILENDFPFPFYPSQTVKHTKSLVPCVLEKAGEQRSVCVCVCARACLYMRQREVSSEKEREHFGNKSSWKENAKEKI